MRRRGFRLSFHFAWAQIRSQWGRLTTTVVAIGLGVALATGILLVNRSLTATLEESFAALAGRADLQVTALGHGTLDEGVVGVMQAVPGVTIATPVVVGTAFPDDDSGELLTVYGVDMLSDAAVRLYKVRGEDGVEMADPLVFLSQPNSIIVTQQLLERRGLVRGGVLSLVTPSGVQRFTVRGVLEPRGVARVFGGSLVVMDVYGAQAAFLHGGQISRVDVVIDRGADIEQVSRALSRVLPPQVAIEHSGTRRAGVASLLASYQLMVDGFSVVGLLVSVLITYSRLSTVFLARLWEIGVTRAIGAPRRAIVRGLLKEAGLLGLAGVALGLPVGVMLAQRIMPAMASILVLGLNVPVQSASVTIAPGPLVIAATMGLVATLLAALAPAVRAVRVPVVAVIRARGRLPVTLDASRRALALRLAPVLVAILLPVGAAFTGASIFGVLFIPVLLLATCAWIAPLVRWLEGPLSAVLVVLAGAPGRFAVADLNRVPQRTVMTVSILTVGLAAVVWFGAMGRSFETFIVGSLGAVRRSDLIVASEFSDGKDTVAVSERLVEEVGAVDGVEAVSGERTSVWDSPHGEIGIVAFDAAQFRNPRLAQWDFDGSPVSDALERVARGAAIFAGSSFMMHHDVHVGDEIALDTPTGPYRVAVAGVSTVSFWSSMGDIVIERGTYERLWKDNLVNRVHVLVKPDHDRDTVRRAIAQRVGRAFRVQVLTAPELAEAFAALVRRGFSMTTAIEIITLIVVMLGTADALAASVVDRTRELGTLRAVGVSPRRIGIMLLTQSLTMGAMGVILASFAGYALSVVWVRWTMRAGLGWVIHLEFHPAALGLAVGLAVLACMLAVVFPARRAMRLSPAEALRYE